ncbi:TadE/TadG family type IV pilus assembly protein [Mycetocola sp.]|uniref:TadE/TadG family type IV pilus assembly protein n=1 Tax=Mycetocola sp. TaxID=1871042 RepID=UPI003989CF67
MCKTRISRSEDGAAAVEFALVLPVLLLLILGLIEFSLVFNSQISLTNAAREGARVMAIQNDPAVARAATINAAPSVNPAVTAGEITIVPADCRAGDTVTVTIDYTADLLTGFFGDELGLRGQGVMLCGG